MKIILVTDKFLPEQTTVGKIVYNLARKLIEDGHAVSIITTTQERAKAGEFVLKKITPEHKNILLEIFQKATKELENSKID